MMRTTIAMLTILSCCMAAGEEPIRNLDLNEDGTISGDKEFKAVLDLAEHIEKQHEAARIVRDVDGLGSFFNPDATEAKLTVGTSSEPGSDLEKYGAGISVKWRPVGLWHSTSANFAPRAIDLLFPDTINFQADLNLSSERTIIQAERKSLKRLEFFPLQVSYLFNRTNLRPFVQLGAAWTRIDTANLQDGTVAKSDDNETSWKAGLAYKNGKLPLEFELANTWRFDKFASGKRSQSFDFTIKRVWKHN